MSARHKNQKYRIELFSGYSIPEGTSALYDIHIVTQSGKTVKVFPHNAAVKYVKLSTRIGIAEEWIAENS